MNQKPELYFEDFHAGQTDVFGDITVTREAIVEFAGQFDPQPFHLDDEAAKAGLFGGLCASGWHTCAMAMRMICDAYLKRAACLGSPGIDKLRWLQPVRPGDRLRLRFEVLDTVVHERRPAIGTVHSRWTMLNQKDEEVMRLDGAIMFSRRTVLV